MRARIRRVSIAARLFALQVLVVALLTVLAVIVLLADARRDVEQDAEMKTAAVANSIAHDPFVIDAAQSQDPSVSLQPYAVELMAATRTDFITILAPDRTRFTHPNPEEIGKPFRGTIAPALRGETITETYTGTLGPSVRTTVPIESAAGTVVAIVSTGVTVANLGVAIQARLPILVAAALAALALGAFASWLLSRYLRRTTGSRGPEELGRMFAYYESVLHAVREGLLLVDREGMLVLYNDAAAALLGLPVPDRRSVPVALSAVGLPEPLSRVILRGERVVDELIVTDSHVLVVNQERAVSGTDAGRSLGTVATLRDHTELQRLTGELHSMHTLADALRSQTHEFSNRMHAVIALIELGRADDAVAFATDELDVGRRFADQLLAAAHEPIFAAILLGKSAQASERGIEFRVDLDPELGSVGLPSVELVTIVGNLLDNAMDAVAGTPGSWIAFSANRTEGELMIRVSDSGPGLSGTEVERAFERGFSTKSSGAAFGRGVGLALVRQAVRRLHGTVTVRGSHFDVRLPLATPGSPWCDEGPVAR
ncbi:sensor histidine kinase [Luethyella okanaganae]|uniref:histidine kinase n=1 Tax=Luethyella okanaganae TaxID=69372 RepID=A0ABW1VDN2_9MICO